MDNLGIRWAYGKHIPWREDGMGKKCVHNNGQWLGRRWAWRNDGAQGKDIPKGKYKDRGKVVSHGWIVVGEKVSMGNDVAHGKDVPKQKNGAWREDVSQEMDNGWGEGGFGEMMGPRENTFPLIKLGLGEKMHL